MSIEIEPFNIKNAANDEYLQLNRFRNAMRAESLPDDPPIPLDEMITGLKNFPPYAEYYVFSAWEPKSASIIGVGEAYIPLEDNLHLAQFKISVLPDFRRQGLARRLLSKIVAITNSKQRRVLITDTIEHIPAGEAFMIRLGANKGLDTHINQLVISEVNKNLIQKWQDQANERASGFSLGFWEGPYPEEDIEAIVVLYDLFNQQPFGDLDMEDFHFTAEKLRQDEKTMFARGNIRWTYYVREISTGNFAGFTEVFWNPNRPDVVTQDLTGVFPEYRNLGLGRWLKAAMLEKILNERSEAKFIRTGNADTNAPMLKINTELGFKPYFSQFLWQIDVEQVSKYLKSQAA